MTHTTYQIVLVYALEEGPRLTSTCALPNAYETYALARKLLWGMLDRGEADGGYLVDAATGTVVPQPVFVAFDGEEIPF